LYDDIILTLKNALYNTKSKELQKKIESEKEHWIKKSMTYSMTDYLKNQDIINEKVEKELAFKNFEKALEYLNILLPMAKRLNDKAEISLILHKIGQIQIELGKYDDALNSYRESLEFDSKGVAWFYIGHIQCFLNNIMKL